MSEQLRSSQGDFPVSLSAMQADDEARKTTVISGLKCLESYQKSSPLTSWARMFTDLLLTKAGWFSNVSTLTWNLRVTKSRRLSYFRLLPSVPRIEGIGSGFVPTPDTTTGAPNKGSNKKNGPKSLTEAAQMLSRMWPTPRAEKIGGYSSKDYGPTLEQAAKQWAPPQSRDFRTGQAARWVNPARSRNLNDQAGGKLSVIFVEWLMGFPEGWTDLKHSVTP